MEQTLLWNENPGAFEQHLRRRYNNPLFEPRRRLVTQRDIDYARERDILDADALAREQVALFDDVPWEDATMDLQLLNEIRERVDELIKRAVEIGGPAEKTLEILHNFREGIIESSRQAFSGTPKLLQLLEDAERYHRDHVVAELLIPFIAQMGRSDGPIPNDEILPSLLMQSHKTIRLVLTNGDEYFQQSFQEEAVGLLRRAFEQGMAIERIDDILDAFEDSL